MATVTSPIILDSTGQDIKTSIDLLTANINRTASNIPYDNNLTIKGKIDAINLTEGGNINGNLSIIGNAFVQRSNSYGIITLGKGTNASENGILQLYDKTSHYANIRTVDNLGDNRNFYLPNKSGTIAIGDISCDSANNEVEFGNFATTFKYSGTTYQNVNIAGVKINYKDFSPARWVIIGYVLSGSSLFGRFVCVSSVDTEKAIVITPQ